MTRVRRHSLVVIKNYISIDWRVQLVIVSQQELEVKKQLLLNQLSSLSSFSK